MPAYTKKSSADRLGGKKRSSREDDYASDDGFVANGSDEGERSRKKSKTAVTKRAPPKKAGNPKDEEELWELTDKRRVQVSEYKGVQMISIREYYEKDGEMLPGKKGISLTVPQYNAFLAILPQIETSLVAKGEILVRPEYDWVATPPRKQSEKATGDEGGIERGAAEGKKNFEATSEEEE